MTCCAAASFEWGLPWHFCACQSQLAERSIPTSLHLHLPCCICHFYHSTTGRWERFEPRATSKRLFAKKKSFPSCLLTCAASKVMFGTTNHLNFGTDTLLIQTNLYYMWFLQAFDCAEAGPSPSLPLDLQVPQASGSCCTHPSILPPFHHPESRHGGHPFPPPTQPQSRPPRWLGPGASFLCKVCHSEQ